MLLVTIHGTNMDSFFFCTFMVQRMWLAVRFVTLFMSVSMTVNGPPRNLFSRKAIRKIMTSLHPTMDSPTIEHCVPQSHYKKTDRWRMARDMHGLTCLPRHLNSHRSNYRLVESISQTEKHDKHGVFAPPPEYRGVYARSIGYIVLTYPSYASLVHTNVLDLNLLIKWSEMYPCTYADEVVHANVASLQQNANPLFLNAVDAYHDITTMLPRSQ